MAEGDTLLNALIGGIASIVLSFVPFSPVLGGAVAGYLEGGDPGDGVRVGLYAGLVAVVPLAVFMFLLFAVFAGFAVGLESGGLGVFAFFLLFAIVATLAYTVGLSALGGWLGNYVKYETDLFE